MSVKKTACSMIAAFKLAVKKLSQTIPKESPGDILPVVSDSISLLLVKRDEPGRSSFYSPLAASGVNLLMSGAASSSEQLKL